MCTHINILYTNVRNYEIHVFITAPVVRNSTVAGVSRSSNILYIILYRMYKCQIVIGGSSTSSSYICDVSQWKRRSAFFFFYYYLLSPFFSRRSSRDDGHPALVYIRTAHTHMHAVIRNAHNTTVAYNENNNMYLYRVMRCQRNSARKRTVNLTSFQHFALKVEKLRLLYSINKSRCMFIIYGPTE